MLIKNFCWIVLTTLMGTTAVLAESDNVIADPGFEEEGQAQWLDYNFGPEFGIDWNAEDQRHGKSRSLKLTATGVTNDANKWEMSGAKQIFPVSPGDIVSGGAWLMVEGLQNVEVFIECKWLDPNQQELGGGIGTVHKTAGSTKWEFQNLDTWTAAERTAPEGAAFVDFRMCMLSAGKADQASGTAWWDDAKLTIIGKGTSKK